ALEAKFQTHGVLTIGATGLLILGALMLVDGPIPEMRVRLVTAIAVSVPFALITVFLMSMALRARRNKVATGAQGLVGQIAVVRAPLTPQGTVFVLGETWNAVGTAPAEMGARMPFGLVAFVIIGFYLLSSIKILREYERGVIFRLGRMLAQPKGPGVILVFWPLDTIMRISLQQEALEVPPQDTITRDNVTLKVNAVITLRVIDPNRAVVQVSNYRYQTSLFAQTTLRSVIGEVELDELLAHRDKLNSRIQSILDGHTEPWGVKVASVEVKQVDLPENMLRAMAKQAEAE